MIAFKITNAVTLLFAIQAFALDQQSHSSSRILSARYEQRQAAQKAPILPRAQLPDPSLAAGNGNGQHKQFVTGQCSSSLDCGAQQVDFSKVCCASVVDTASGKTVGVCSGSAVGNAAPKLGCGFGDGKVNSGTGADTVKSSSSSCGNASAGSAGSAPAAGGISSNGGEGGASGGAAAGASSGGKCPPKTTNDSLGPGNVGVAGKQFVTGQCTSDSNCASGCCVFGGGSDKSIAVCRNQPALKPTESCGFSCTA